MVFTEAAPVICKVVFHQDKPELSPSTPTENAGRTAPPARASDALADQSLTKTANPQNSIPTPIRGGKSISNHTQPTGGYGAEYELATDRKSDTTSVASSGAINSDSGYYELGNNLPASLENHTKLEVQLHKIDQIYEDVSTDLEELSSTRVLFTHPHELGPMDPANEEDNLTTPPKKMTL